jgi:serine/threonine-protein kinase
MLYEMLAGRPPFAAGTTAGLLRQRLTAEPQPVTDHRPAVPPPVAAAIARGLARLPADRFASVAACAAALATGGAGPGVATELPAPASARRRS